MKVEPLLFLTRSPLALFSEKSALCPLPNGIPLPAGGRIELQPGGFHIMFLDLQRPLKQGEKVGGTLVFERAGVVQIEFQIDAIGSQGSASGDHQH